VIGSFEWAEIDRTEIDRMADRKEIVGQLGGSDWAAAGGKQEF
jgi:hypothetical protein